MKIMKIMKKIFSKKEAPDYPAEFIIIDYSPRARQEGVYDENNKLIYFYYFDKYGLRKIKKYLYSDARLDSIKSVFKVPSYDKTKKKEVLPIFAKILPSEITYKT